VNKRLLRPNLARIAPSVPSGFVRTAQPAPPAGFPYEGTSGRGTGLRAARASLSRQGGRLLAMAACLACFGAPAQSNAVGAAGPTPTDTRTSTALSAALTVEPIGASGRDALLVWTLLNEGDLEQSVEVPATIEVSVAGDGREHRVPGLLLSGSDWLQRAGRVGIAPGQFRRIRYRLELPTDTGGALVFRTSTGGRALTAFADWPAVPASGMAASGPGAAGRSAAGAPGGAPIFAVPSSAAQDIAAPAGTPARTPQAASPAAGRAAPARLTLTDRLGSAISAHEPNYIVFGDRVRRNSRFQISFKYRFFNEDGDLAQDITPLRHLYFGYAQTALWDIESDSAPFRDSSYRPSLFYRNDLLWASPAKDVRLGIATGLEHESNGRDGLSSRSINIAFVRPTLRLGDPTGWHLTLAPKVYGYLDRTGNTDIARYRGHADLFASIGHPDRWQFAATVRRGTGNRFGSTMIEASYPLRTVSLGNLDGYFFFQYFNGYGDSILDYNRRFPAQLRVGFAITRWP